MSGSANFRTLKGNHPAVHSQQGLTQRETLSQASIVQKHKQTIKLILGLMYMAKKHYTQKIRDETYWTHGFCLQICWGKPCKFSQASPKTIAGNATSSHFESSQAPDAYSTWCKRPCSGERDARKSRAVHSDFGCWSRSPVKNTPKKQTN